MSTQNSSNLDQSGSSTAGLLGELEQIDTALRTSWEWIVTLEKRRQAISETLENQSPHRTMSQQTAKKIGIGLEFNGVVIQHRTCIDIHLDLLRRLWLEYPDKRDAMAMAIAAIGRLRPYVARNVADLFPNQPIEFARKHGRLLVDDWYADVNHSVARMRRILPKAVRAAGLVWNKDVKVYWRRTQMC